ncbi:hypothetical protein DUNSADRAFT_11409 [Dunaliella salina]|uniref:Encoded protein n=1 Tax=Dunaliella salina TaxID=3046 RepID=A0ABQ7GDJ0_DUNSA|nr:hypothetical protein DUNSADRAFT_11409 [Dunaliella salina]|eukprot:KAF5832664.1 hypothetical protein DUNSADRAFT_11409 [Dunaliella salina]
MKQSCMPSFSNTHPVLLHAFVFKLRDGSKSPEEAWSTIQNPQPANRGGGRCRRPERQGRCRPLLCAGRPHFSPRPRHLFTRPNQGDSWAGSPSPGCFQEFFVVPRPSKFLQGQTIFLPHPHTCT